MSNTTNQDRLAALRKQAVNDQAKEAKAAKSSRQKKGGANGTRSTGPPTSQRNCTTVMLTPTAKEAMQKLQAFLLTECKATSPNASAAICIALELAASRIKENATDIKEIFAERQASDGRRRV